MREELLGLYYKEGVTIEEIDNILLYFFQEVESPARLAGQYSAGARNAEPDCKPCARPGCTTPVSAVYAGRPTWPMIIPGTASDGLRTNDMTDMFNGAMDRFNWELVGKKEMYVPYNSYKAHQPRRDTGRPGACPGT